MGRDSIELAIHVPTGSVQVALSVQRVRQDVIVMHTCQFLLSLVVFWVLLALTPGLVKPRKARTLHPTHKKSPLAHGLLPNPYVFHLVLEDAKEGI